MYVAAELKSIFFPTLSITNIYLHYISEAEISKTGQINYFHKEMSLKEKKKWI